MTTLLIAALVTFAADADPAPPKLPTGAAPTMLVLQAKDKALVHEQTVQVAETVPVREKVTVGGKEVERTAYRTVTKSVLQKNTYPIEGTTFQTAGGKKLDKEDALKKLATPTLVVLSADGKPVDEGFLAALKPGTLVVIAPVPAPLPPAAVRPLIRPLPAIKIAPPAVPPPPKE